MQQQEANPANTHNAAIIKPNESSKFSVRIWGEIQVSFLGKCKGKLPANNLQGGVRMEVVNYQGRMELLQDFDIFHPETHSNIRS